MTWGEEGKRAMATFTAGVTAFLGEWQYDTRLGSDPLGSLFRVATYRGSAKVYNLLRYCTWPEAGAVGLREEQLRATAFRLQHDLSRYQGIDSQHLLRCNQSSVAETEARREWEIFVRSDSLPDIKSAAAGGPVTEERVTRMGVDLCDALEQLHENKLLHLNISNATVYQAPQNTYVLGDAWLSPLVMDLAGRRPSDTISMNLAPELYRNAPCGVRSDVYSLGLFLFRLLNGGRPPLLPAELKKPGLGAYQQAFDLRVGGARLPMPGNGASPLALVVHKACQFAPEDRFASAREMKAALEACLTGPPEVQGSPAPQKPAERAEAEVPSGSPPQRADAKIGTHHPAPAVAIGARGKVSLRKRTLALLLASMLLLGIAAGLIGSAVYAHAVGDPAEMAASEVSLVPEVPTDIPPVDSSESREDADAAEEERIPEAKGAFDVAGIPPLYNRFNEIPQRVYDELDLVDVGGGQSMDRQAAGAFTAMYNAAAAEGVYLTPRSGFRSHGTQVDLYNTSVNRYLGEGYSEEEAIRRTEAYYAIPGTSEHEAGLAMDILLVDDSFADTEQYQWLQQHCAEYGFIYRYQKEYTDITYIAWESWHYRFVGVNHAAEMKKLGFHTLEEYVEYLDDAPS